MAEYTDIGSMSKALPLGTGQLSQADDHIRGVKTAVKNTFPNVLGVVDATTAELNALTGLDVADSIETRFTELEAYFNYTATKMTVDQMSMLWDLKTNATVEGRLGVLEFKTEDVTQPEIAMLAGYDWLRAPKPVTIEDRFQYAEAEITSLWGQYDFLLQKVTPIEQWWLYREAQFPNDKLYQITSYLGVNFPQGSGYINSLGPDMLLLTQKVSYLEYLAGFGVNPGVITWKTLIANLNGGDGGINVTNSKDGSWGFVMVGLIPGSKIDFQFYDNAGPGWGPAASDVNQGSKQLLVDDSGEVNANIQLGDLPWGPGGQKLVNGSTGRVKVTGRRRKADGGEESVTHDVFCAYYGT